MNNNPSVNSHGSENSEPALNNVPPVESSPPLKAVDSPVAKAPPTVVIPALPACGVEVRNGSAPALILDQALFQSLLLGLILLILELGSKSGVQIKVVIEAMAKGRLPSGVMAQVRALISKALLECRDLNANRRQLVTGLLSAPVPALEMGGVTGCGLTATGYDIAITVGGKTTVVSVALPPGFVLGLANAVLSTAGRVVRAGNMSEVESLVRQLAEGVVDQKLADAMTLVVGGGLSKLPTITKEQKDSFLGLDVFGEVLDRHAKAA